MAKILAIEQDDGGGDQIERGSPHLLVFRAAVAETTKPVECYGARKGVAGFALIQFRRDQSSQAGVFEPTQREQRTLDPADLSQGAKFWLRVMNELKNRGLADMLIAVVDGLKGFPEAINAVFPETVVQTCVVHLIRNSMSFASWKDRKSIASALRSVYRAENAEAGLTALEAFEAGQWGQKYPAIAQSWRRHWDQVIPFFAFS